MCSQQDTENAHILCPQCDMLVALPRLTRGTKSVCPRCGTTLAMRWRHPHLQPTLYAASALFLLVVANLFSFVTMSVAGISNAITLIQIPGMLMAENYVSIATLFMIFVQVIPAFCMVVIILLCLRIPLPVMLRVGLARILLQCRARCMVEIFLAGVLVSFVKLMAYGDVGVGSSFGPTVCFACFRSAHFRWWSADSCGMTSPRRHPATCRSAAVKPGCDRGCAPVPAVRRSCRRISISVRVV